MAIYEHDTLIDIKDTNGDHHLHYPITKAANVDGLDEAIKAGAGEVGNDLSNHLTDENAHGALFAKKQDKIKGKKGKFVGFMADNTVGEVDAPASGGSRITMRFAADFAGCAWTLSGGGEQYTGTVDSSLTATVSVLGIGTTYTLSAAIGGVTYTAEVTTKDYYTALAVALEKFLSTIIVTVDSGSTVMATLGSTILTRTSTGTAVFTVNKSGTWVIKASKGSDTASGTVTISKSGESKALRLSYANVFGVCWDTSNSSTALTRLTPSTDPYGLVTKSVTTEPKPAISAGGSSPAAGNGSSPFDAYLPWSGMKECNLNHDGSVKAWKTDSGFARSHWATMVFIPVFYVAAKRNGTKQYFYVSDKPQNGMVKHPGSGKYVGKYAAGDINSNTGATPVTNHPRSEFRSWAKSTGAKWHLYDFATYCAIIFLYVVEFADWNCQSKIGVGYSEGSSLQPNGCTDSLLYHTGKTIISVGVKYREIENLWGNAFQFVDGFNINGTTAYYCTDPSKYADDTSNGYTKIGTVPRNGWIKDLIVTDNGLLIPKTSGGSATTYIPDYVSSASGWHILKVGGGWNEGSNAGLLCFYASPPTSDANSSTSARLMCEA